MKMKISGQIIDGGFDGLKKEPHIHAGHAVPRIWVIVADRKRAHIYRKTAESLEKIADANADGKDMVIMGHSEIKGHFLPSHGASHHDQRDDEYQDDMNFVHGLAGWLDQAVREDAFDRIVVVAAPRTLGNIRAALTHPVHARVMAEISKELTKLDPKKLREELAKIIWF
jgi:protein required for attachment to host cells